MGVIVDTIRMQYLNNVKMDLEYKIQLITQARMGLTQSANDLMQVGSDYSPDSPVVKQLNQRQAKLKALEQKLEQQMIQYQARLQMVKTEYEACRSRLYENIGHSFRYN